MNCLTKVNAKINADDAFSGVIEPQGEESTSDKSRNKATQVILTLRTHCIAFNFGQNFLAA